MGKWFIVAALLVLVGCSYMAPIGPIVQLGVMWIEGEAHKYYNTDRTTLHAAVKSALHELDLPIKEESKSNDTITIKAGDNDRFKIKVHQVRDKTTKLSIRVNIMGDKPYAEMIYRHVDKQSNVEQFASLKELNTALEDRPRESRKIRPLK
jgi:hypothetical protein